MSRRPRFQCWSACAAATLLGGLYAPAAPAEDLFAGTWELRPEESKYLNGELPESMTIRLEPSDRGEHYTSRTVRQNKQVATAEYTAGYDGSLAMVLGDAGLLAPVSLRRIDDYTVEATYQRAFHVVARTRRVISADGLTMTLATTTDAGPSGDVNVSVFKKRPPVPVRAQHGQSQ
jgi:hypothetical protein